MLPCLTAIERKFLLWKVNFQVYFPYWQVERKVSVEPCNTSAFLAKLNTNLLVIEHECRTGEYWPEVVAERTERSEVSTTESQYFPVRLDLARLVSSLLYGTRARLIFNLPAFETTTTKKQSMTVSMETAPYGEIPTKKEPIRTPRFPKDYFAM